MLAWFTRTLLEAPDAFGELEAAAAQIVPGASGLIALDWFNGNRSILADADLTGMIVGLTLASTRAEIYRALIEAIGFGNRRIVDNFTEHGVAIAEIVAVGGIAERSPLAMQILADTSGLTVSVPGSGEVPARGAALFGAVAAGAFSGIDAATAAARPAAARSFTPDPTAVAVYDEVYAIYRELYDLFRRAPGPGSCTASSGSPPRGDTHDVHARAPEDRTARDHAGAVRRHGARDHRAPGRLCP